MIYLLLSVGASTAIYLLFKQFSKWNIRTFEAIVANYFTALTIGLLVVPDLPAAWQTAKTFPVWFSGGLVLGIFFISIFYLMAITAQKVGVSVATIASKMSLALAAILFMIVDPAETAGAGKITAIVLALVGVVLASLKEDGGKLEARHLLWPVVILLGSTVIDFGVAFFSEKTTGENELALYSCLSFATAALVGLLIVIKHSFTPGYRIRPVDFIAGIGLGIVNYGSIYFLIKAYDSGVFAKSALLPINNLGVVLLGALGAVVIFREKLNKWNMLGIALSVLAIALIYLDK
jgi:drug/metabolite transporter (DMT)-like permease